MCTRLVRVSCLALLLLALVGHSYAQTQTPAQQSDDVLRVTTELVQTDVMVFDRRGRFVDGLRPEQFILTLNGEAKKISMFGRIASGSSAEAGQLTATRSVAAPPNLPNVIRPGRLIFFFVDDIHLSGESLARSRKALLNFVESRLNPEDRVAIVSSSGQIGFLQQLTDNSAVMHEAIARLKYKQNSETYAGSTRISEYVANQIEDSGNRQLFAYLMESVKLEYGMGLGARRGAHSIDSGAQARRLLHSRISQINAQSKITTTNTLEVLERLMESSAGLPGRKLVYFLSDGFMVGPRSSSALDVLHQATRIAARSGAVIYSVDMRGTFLESSIDASHNDYVDMTSRHAGVAMGELLEPREPLNVLADETGGRLIINSTDLDRDLAQAISETSNYYLLAWRPDSEAERGGKARLEISIAGRPELKVRLRRAYYVSEKSTANAKENVKARPNPEGEILAALGSSESLRTLPVALSVGFVRNSESAYSLQASMQLPREVFNLEPEGAKKKSEVDVIGAAIDDRGLIYSFKQVLTVTPPPADQARLPVIWNQHLNVRPGLYQVRVAVRERSSGRTGSAMEWIEILKTTSPRLTMSSLFLGERRPEGEGQKTQAREPQSIPVEVDRRFARGSVLRFQTYVYNASRSSSAPEVWIDARVLRGNQPVLVLSPNKVPSDLSKDAWRLPYWSEIALAQLTPGSYTLQVSATDRIGGGNASQRITFSIE
ncbi:MAG: VWA domain-containing protein [Pyrinomonadaceae bacterium]